MADSLAPTTTVEQDKYTRTARSINLIWEMTQGIVAFAITMAVIYCAVQKIASPELSNGFFLVIGFYFGRTNHARRGGREDFS